MAEPKDGSGGFLRKVARFVANPATDWKDIGTRPEESQDLERSELKAMVERKRRNDFVRKRELDTLRRLRREGLSPEQLAALGGSSKVDDSEVRLNDSAHNVRNDVGVKAKIDAIEQQMVGEGPPQRPAPIRRAAGDARRAPPGPASQRPQSDFYSAASERMAPDPGAGPGAARPVGAALPTLGSLPPLPAHGPAAALPPRPGSALPPLPQLPPVPPAPGQPSAARATDPLAGRPGLPMADLDFAPDSRFAVEVSEVVHDPELDEAVIAFANADFATCEAALTALCKPYASRHEHGDTWLVLFDLYRAVGQQHKFEALSLDYAHLFGRSSPQWYSLPKLVADAAADDRPDTHDLRGDVGWVSPIRLDTEAVAQLRSTTLQLPLPWVLDWSAVEQVDAEAASQLQTLFRQWAPQPLDMRWMAAERLLAALQEAAPTGVRDADPAFWMARLEALRLSNRPDQFDEAAIDYCVTYEVSPPSWESARCIVRSRGAGPSTSVPSMSMVSEAASSFLESGTHEEGQVSQRVVAVDLSGQLAGDIGAVLDQIDRKLGHAALVSVSCARLIRVDFIAAGDLLNWVLAKQNEQRSVTFTDAHRLVALFFGAMGINEHARVQLIRQ